MEKRYNHNAFVETIGILKGKSRQGRKLVFSSIYRPKRWLTDYSNMNFYYNTNFRTLSKQYISLQDQLERLYNIKRVMGTK